jgi:hypothetical protein
VDRQVYRKHKQKIGSIIRYSLLIGLLATSLSLLISEPKLKQYFLYLLVAFWLGLIWFDWQKFYKVKELDKAQIILSSNYSNSLKTGRQIIAIKEIQEIEVDRYGYFTVKLFSGEIYHLDPKSLTKESWKLLKRVYIIGIELINFS